MGVQLRRDILDYTRLLDSVCLVYLFQGMLSCLLNTKPYAICLKLNSGMAYFIVYFPMPLLLLFLLYP